MTENTSDRYHVQVYVREGGQVYAWRRVRPINDDPYVFTREEALSYCKTHGLTDPECYRIERL